MTNPEGSDRQQKHSAIIVALNTLTNSIDALENLVRRVKGDDSPLNAEREQIKTKPPALATFLEETPDELGLLSDRLSSVNVTLNEMLF